MKLNQLYNIKKSLIKMKKQCKRRTFKVVANFPNKNLVSKNKHINNNNNNNKRI